MEQIFSFPGAAIPEAAFSTEENTLAVRFGALTLVFHDSLKKGGERYRLFHEKTRIAPSGDAAVEIRTAAVCDGDGAPVPGLTAIYRFTFDERERAFYLSASFASDSPVCGYAVRLFDVSWRGMEAERFTGFESDAEGKPFSHVFPQPEPNPDALDYETLMRTRPHVAWEKMKTRPHTFRRGVLLEGGGEAFAVFGGTPTYHVESAFVSVFTNFPEYDGDLRFFSGENAPGAWFLLDPADPVSAADALEERIPLPEKSEFVPFPEEEYDLTSGELSLRLVRCRGGVWTAPVFRGGEGECQLAPFFRMELYDTLYGRSLTLDSGNGWNEVRVTQREKFMRVTLSDPDHGRISGITVTAEGSFDPERSRILWKTTVVNRSDRYSLTNITYPQLLAAGFETAFTPVGSGILEPAFNRRSHTFKGKYPFGVKINMGYAALYDPRPGGEGVYFGVHDPDGNPKYLTLAGAPVSDCTLLSAEIPAPWPKKAGNSFTLPGEAVWQRFRGDWYDATLLWREFVHARAEWLAPLRGRPDSPKWLRETPVWIMHFMPNENPDANPFPITLREKYADRDPADWYRTAVRFREEIGVPVAYHLYNWHWVPFNNDNPHYFPTHHDLKAGLRELKEADIRVVPYIAAYSWDMCDERGGDYRFEKEARPATAKNQDGEPIYASYASTEPTGQAVRFARMCPTTAVWKNEVRQITRRLYEEYGADGIYLDVVSAGYASCCDETHLHPPGSGDFWRRAYAELIQGVRAATGEEFAVVSESTSEVYSGVLDGFLSWTWVQVGGVPAFPAVYGGRTAIFGRVITQNKRDDAFYFRFQIAQSLVFGQQLGWIHPEIVDDPEQFPFLKKMARLRWEAREFFVGAEMLRPPKVEGRMDLYDGEAFLRGQIWNHEKGVVAGAWEDTEGERRLYVVNSGENEAFVTLSVPEGEYAFPEYPSFDSAEGAGITAYVVAEGEARMTLHLEGEGWGVVKWRKEE